MYCNIVKTIMSYEYSLNYLKHMKLDKDTRQGDVINSCIITSTGNPFSSFKKTDLAVVMPISLIDIIESNRNDIRLDDFEKIRIDKDVWRYIRR